MKIPCPYRRLLMRSKSEEGTYIENFTFVPVSVLDAERRSGEALGFTFINQMPCTGNALLKVDAFDEGFGSALLSINWYCTNNHWIRNDCMPSLPVTADTLDDFLNTYFEFNQDTPLKQAQKPFWENVKID